MEAAIMIDADKDNIDFDAGYRWEHEENRKSTKPKELDEEFLELIINADIENPQENERGSVDD